MSNRAVVLYFCPTCPSMLANEANGPCDDCLDYGLGCIIPVRKPLQSNKEQDGCDGPGGPP